MSSNYLFSYPRMWRIAISLLLLPVLSKAFLKTPRCQLHQVVHIRRIDSHQQRALFKQRLASSARDTTEVCVQDLEDMKVGDLKSLLKQFGGKPGNMRKADLVAHCTRYLSSDHSPIVPLPQTASSTATKISVSSILDAAATASAKSLAQSMTAPAAVRTLQSAGAASSSRIRSMPPLIDKSSILQDTDSIEFSDDTTTEFQEQDWQEVSKDDGNQQQQHYQQQPQQQQQQQQQQSQQHDHHLQRIWKKTTVSNTKQASNAMSQKSSKATENNRKWGDFPSGPRRDERLANEPVGDMELTFLGTASCTPTITRGVSCIAMRFLGDTWLFDCGESTQVQLGKSQIKASRITKIFITHLHGDHAFGLAGVLCLIGQTTNDERQLLQGVGEQIEPVDIYGPEGTRDMIRAVIQLSYSKIVACYRVHELKDIPFLHGRYSRPPVTSVVRTRADRLYGELEGSDIYPDAEGHYHLMEDDNFAVKAAPMQHTVPCVGFVVHEHQKPGTLRPDRVEGIVEANKEALKLIYRGAYKKVFQALKELKPSESYEFPDGTVVVADDFVDPPVRGRKLVIMGDTCSGEHIVPLAQGADVLVHEATNAFIYELDAGRHGSFGNLERDTIRHGHSTPQMAGALAAKIGAKRLILTHFSPRYLGDASEFSMRLMWRMEEQARAAARLDEHPNAVIAAWDQMVLPVANNKSPAKLEAENIAMAAGNKKKAAQQNSGRRGGRN